MKINSYTAGALAVLAIGFALATQATIAQQTNDQESQTLDRQNLDQPSVNRNNSTQLRTEGTQQDNRQGTANRRHARHGNSFKASELIGMNVRGSSGDDDVGSIDDLMITKNGRVEYAAVSFGGFLGVGDKKFAVPFDAIEFVVTDEESYARVNVSEENLKDREGFDQDNWPEHADRAFGGAGQSQTDRPADTDVSR